MKNLKNIAVCIAVCMIVSIMPIVSFATPWEDNFVSVAETTTDPDATADPDATTEPTTEPDVTPEPTTDPDATAKPTTDPDATAEPTKDPSETENPDATNTPAPTATAKPGSKYSIQIEEVDNSVIKVNPTSAAKGVKVKVNGKATRGYNYVNAYYSNADNKQTALVTKACNSFEKTFVMPDSNVTITSKVQELSPSEVVTDAETQITDSKALNSTYTTRYINNSSSYSSSDISKMRNFIKSSQSQMTDLTSAKKELKDAIDDKDITTNIMNDVINIQIELDDIMDSMKKLAESMGGEDVDEFDITITAKKGGKVTMSGLTSGVVNGFSTQRTETFENIENDGKSSLTFTIATQSGYSFTSLKINNKTVSSSGNRVTINASSLASYVSGGEMEVTANFTYSNNGGGGGSGNTGGGSIIGGGDPQPTADPQPIYGFTDIGDVAWAQDSIMALYNLGVVNGRGDGIFEPNAHVKREEFAKMIVGVMGYSIDSGATTSFTDDAGDWYTPYISAAVNNGIITGRDDGTFGVGDDITRQDIAVIIHRAMGTAASEAISFPDTDQISDYAVDAVSYLAANNIVSGDDLGNFNPKNPATRAESSKILYGFYSMNN